MTLDSLAKNKKAINLAIFIIWLVHVSAIIGIFLGYDNWFITKTPLNLLLLLIILLVFFPLTYKKGLVVFAIIFLGGFISEVIGVNTGLLFGSYQYGNNLGLKIAGVPLLIGINWAVLVVVSAEISKKIRIPVWLKAVIAAGLMVLLDIFIEPLAPYLDFWTWTNGHPPLFNYITWFVVAYGLILFYYKSGIRGNIQIASNIYLSQLFFFCLLNIERIL